MLDTAGWVVLESAAQSLAESSSRLGERVDVDARALLSRRGLEAQGPISANGTCRLLPTKDGWAAISLNRPDDWELLPVLFRTDIGEWDWDAVASAISATAGADLEVGATELGLALAVLPDEAPRVDQPWRITSTGQGHARPLARVVDLSALWAGPLCAFLLHQVGAEVLTVQSTTRPDSARVYEADELVSLDFATAEGRDELHRLIKGADVVITACRARALAGLGLDPIALTRRSPGLTWVGISAYVRTGPWNNRIGYGDDTAVAGGLVRRGHTPAFIGDAIADPITGLYAAVAALRVAASGGGVVDIALRDAAAHVARAQR